MEIDNSEEMSTTTYQSTIRETLSNSTTHPTLSNPDRDIIHGTIIGVGLLALICLIIILVVIIRKKSNKSKRSQAEVTSCQHPGTSSAIHWTTGQASVTLHRNGASDSVMGHNYPSTVAIVGETDDYVNEDDMGTSALNRPNIILPAKEPNKDQEEEEYIYVNVESTDNNEIISVHGVLPKSEDDLNTDTDEMKSPGVIKRGVKPMNSYGLPTSRSESGISAGSSNTSRLRERTGFKWEVTVPITHKESECIGNRESSGVYIDMCQSSPSKRFSLTPPSPTHHGVKEQSRFEGPGLDLPLPPPPCGATSHHQYVNMKNGDPRGLCTLNPQKFSDDPSGYCFANGLADVSDNHQFTDDEGDHGENEDAVYEIPGGAPLKLKSILQRESFNYRNLENQSSLSDDHADDPPEIMYIVPTSPLANTPKTPDSDDGYYENATALLFESKLKSHLRNIEANKTVDTSKELVNKIPPPVMPKTKRPTYNTTSGNHCQQTHQHQHPGGEGNNNSPPHGLNNESRVQPPAAIQMKNNTEEDRDSGLGLTKLQRQPPILAPGLGARNPVYENSFGVNEDICSSIEQNLADDDEEDDGDCYVNVSEIVKQSAG